MRRIYHRNWQPKAPLTHTHWALTSVPQIPKSPLFISLPGRPWECLIALSTTTDIMITEYFRSSSFQASPGKTRLSSVTACVLRLLSLQWDTCWPLQLPPLEHQSEFSPSWHAIWPVSLWYYRTLSPNENRLILCSHFLKLWLNSYP